MSDDNDACMKYWMTPWMTSSFTSCTTSTFQDMNDNFHSCSSMLLSLPSLPPPSYLPAYMSAYDNIGHFDTSTVQVFTWLCDLQLPAGLNVHAVTLSLASYGFDSLSSMGLCTEMDLISYGILLHEHVMAILHGRTFDLECIDMVTRFGISEWLSSIAIPATYVVLYTALLADMGFYTVESLVTYNVLNKLMCTIWLEGHVRLFNHFQLRLAACFPVEMATLNGLELIPMATPVVSSQCIPMTAPYLPPQLVGFLYTPPFMSQEKTKPKKKSKKRACRSTPKKDPAFSDVHVALMAKAIVDIKCTSGKRMRWRMLASGTSTNPEYKPLSIFTAVQLRVIYRKLHGDKFRQKKQLVKCNI